MIAEDRRSPVTPDDNNNENGEENPEYPPGF
jgi:hypothetical protein